MKRMAVICLLSALLCGLLSGCLLESPDELYALPSPGQDYVNLKSKIDQVSAQLGAEYAAPLSGSNTQTVQLVDLDGDGIQESAVAFFRVSSAEKPLKIYVFQQDQDGNYSTAYSIEGEGSAIYSIDYEDIGGTKDRELIVSWQLSENVHTLAAYSLKDQVELMRSGYTKFEMADLDGDQQDEIILLQVDSTESNNRAEYYDYSDGVMLLSSSAPMSLNVTGINSLRSGYLTNHVPAVFVTSSFGMNGGVLTDIFALRNNVLENVTMQETTSMSSDTICYYSKEDPQDVNGDSILEVPSPELVPVYGEDSDDTENLWLLHWYQYDSEGRATLVYTTFHNDSEGWYFIVPDAWVGEITITQSSPLLGVQQTTFAHWTQDGEEPQPFLSIYKLTGSNRYNRAQLDPRFQLLPETDNAIYVAEFNENSWQCGLDEDGVISRFELIQSEWSIEEG
ncbi:MAG: hypothetical protein H6Q60_1326 [Oscillospiraceae bacterium]|nr:hypothetical protein [Oscillospiraceae bacterium]